MRFEQMLEGSSRACSGFIAEGTEGTGRPLEVAHAFRFDLCTGRDAASTCMFYPTLLGVGYVLGVHSRWTF